MGTDYNWQGANGGTLNASVNGVGGLIKANSLYINNTSGTIAVGSGAMFYVTNSMQPNNNASGASDVLYLNPSSGGTIQTGGSINQWTFSNVTATVPSDPIAKLE